MRSLQALFFSSAVLAASLASINGSPEGPGYHTDILPLHKQTAADGQAINIALEELNKVRTSLGLSHLCINKALQESAQIESNSNSLIQDLDHSEGLQKSRGYPTNAATGENIAATLIGQSDDADCFRSVDAVTDPISSAYFVTNCQWYKSKSHRASMENPDFNQVGIAFTVGSYEGNMAYYWTQSFGKSDQSCLYSGSRSGVNSTAGARNSDIPQPANKGAKIPQPTTKKGVNAPQHIKKGANNVRLNDKKAVSASNSNVKPGFKSLRTKLRCVLRGRRITKTIKKCKAGYHFTLTHISYPFYSHNSY